MTCVHSVSRSASRISITHVWTWVSRPRWLEPRACRSPCSGTAPCALAPNVLGNRGGSEFRLQPHPPTGAIDAYSTAVCGCFTVILGERLGDLDVLPPEDARSPGGRLVRGRTTRRGGTMATRVLLPREMIPPSTSSQSVNQLDPYIINTIHTIL